MIRRNIKRLEESDYCEAGHASDNLIQVDNLNVSIKREFVGWLDLDRFKEIAVTRTVKEFGEKKKITVKVYECVPEEIRGLGKIWIYPDRVVISFGSKILGCDYRQLLHLGNIREALRLIQATGLIFFDTEKVMSHGIFTRGDFTKNIQLGSEKAVREFISFTAVLGGANTWSYTYKPGRKGSLGGIFKREGEVLKFYYKHFQAQLKSKSKGDLAAFEHVVTNGWEAESLGIARVESTLRTKAKMLKVLGIKDRRMITVFSAKCCPIVSMFENIVRHANIGKMDKHSHFFKLDLTQMKIKQQQIIGHVSFLIDTYKTIPAIRAVLLSGPDDKSRISRYINDWVKPEINRRAAEGVCKNIGGVRDIENRINTMIEYLKAG